MEENITPTLFQLKKSLGTLESEIMIIIWQKRQVNVREVLNILREDKPIAYTTVMTVMVHLKNKNFLKRIKVGKTYYYQSAITTNAAISNSFSTLLKTLASDYGLKKLSASIITNNLIPKINLPIISICSNLAKYSLFLTLCIVLFGLSLYDLYHNLKSFGVLDYFNLFTSEPDIFGDKVHLAIFAIVENLPFINILTTLSSFILLIYLMRKLIKLIFIRPRISL